MKTIMPSTYATPSKGSLPTAKSNRHMTPGGVVERIRSPVKAKMMLLDDRMSTDEEQEGSTPQEFFSSFLKLRQYFKGEISVKKANKAIKEMSKIKEIPDLKDLEAIKNEDVSQSPAFYSIKPLPSLSSLK